jgi:hypothetical protein
MGRKVPLRAVLLAAVLVSVSGVAFIMSTSCPGPTTVTVGTHPLVDSISLVSSGYYTQNM